MGVVGSREQFLHCGLRKFRHSKSSVYRWYTQLDRRRFVYDTWDNGSRLGHVMVECTLSVTHCLRLNLQLHTIDLVRTCRISSFCTVAWQLARFQLRRRIARSLGDSWASCMELWPTGAAWCSFGHRTQYTVLLPLQTNVSPSVCHVRVLYSNGKDINTISFASCSPAILVSGVWWGSVGPYSTVA